MVKTWDDYYSEAVPRLVEVIHSGAAVECLRLGPGALRAFLAHVDRPHLKGSVSSEDAVSAARREAGERLANGLRLVPGDREGVEVVVVDLGKESQARKPMLRLWLPALHTVSQNRTKGRGWIVTYKARQAEAGALAAALPGGDEGSQFARRVLAGIAMGVPVKTIKTWKKTALSAECLVMSTGKPRLTYTRVTCSTLDTENFCGSTKGMTDCLRYAFPWWLPDDRPEDVEILHKQERCATRDEEGTWVELRLDGNDE